jgi:hypothetical protein
MRRSRVIGWLAAAAVTCVAGWLLFDLARYGWIAVAIIGNALLLPMWTVAVFYLLAPNLRHPSLERYFEPKAWERGGTSYLHVGVFRIQALLELLGRGRPRGFRVRRDKVFLERMEYETRAAEAAHGLCFLVMVGLAAYAAIVGSIAGMCWLVGTALAFQAPAVILQRYHRPRWRRLLRTLSAKVAQGGVAEPNDNESGHGCYRAQGGA